jgi:hypothetical protein
MIVFKLFMALLIHEITVTLTFNDANKFFVRNR